ncbi:hypothetical protein N7507_011476 [Penicillium longicatenatum]|nr:hypothetical protein N7507_011476 [Penicillium longicatenatum]
MVTPRAPDHRIHTHVPVNNELALEQAPPTCNAVACIGLTGTLTCILSAISGGDTTALQRCLSGGLGEICSCAACIPQVNNFLQALGICVTALDTDITASSLSRLFVALSEMKPSAILSTKFDASQTVPVCTSSNAYI